jgi:class II lanthipeptide synthase
MTPGHCQLQNFDPEERIYLALHAETIDDVFDLVRNAFPASQLGTHEREKIWRSAIMADKRSVIIRRINKEGFTVDQFFSYIVTLPEPDAEQPWIGTLETILSSLTAEGTIGASAAGAASVEEQLPFIDLFSPLASVLAGQIDDLLVGRALQGQGKQGQAFAKLKRWLIARLCDFTVPALYETFDRQRALSPTASNEGTGEIYTRFVRDFRAAECKRFILSKPVIGRAWAGLVTNWTDSVTETLTRLANDRQRIASFLQRDTLGSVIDVGTGLSDPHNGGRSVLIFTFEGGHKIVYKPRSLAPEMAVERLLSQLTQLGAPPLAATMPSLDCAGYGWQRYVQPHDCEDLERVTVLFRRIGASLALFRLLGTTDIHQDNIIAAGDVPVIVDLETVVHGNYSWDTHHHPAIVEACRLLNESVVRTGLLPISVRTATGDVFRIGGLSPPEPVPAWGWRIVDANTDRMRIAKELIERRDNHHLPKLDGKPQAAYRHVDAVVGGYRDMVSFIEAHRSELTLLLKDLVHGPVRLIPRPTDSYDSLINLLRDPRTQENGIMWSSRLEINYLEFEPPNGLLADSGLLRAERRAMVDLDVPYFWVQEDGRAIRDRGGIVVSDLLDEPISCAPLRNISHFDPQCQATDTSAITILLAEEFGAGRESTMPVPWSNGSSLWTESQVRAEVGRIHDIVATQAIRKAGGATWLGALSVGDHGHSMGPLGYGLYNGVTGIAVFLAAWARIARDKRAEVLALEVMRTLEYALNNPQSPDPQLPKTIGIAGLGGIIYGAALIGQLVADEHCLNVAYRAASFVSKDMILTDEVFDVFEGAAGIIPALLKLYHYRQERWLLDLAVVAGEHLLEVHRDGAGPRAWWRSKDGDVMAGFAHGISGIRFALDRLASATGRQDIARIVQNANIKLDSGYDDSVSEWPFYYPDSPHRKPSDPAVSRWCQGSVGIGLSYLCCANTKLDEPNLKRALDAALGAAVRPVDFLCCGNFGLVDLLIEGGKVDHKLLTEARRRAAILIARARAAGHYAHERLDDHLNLSFFRGVCGNGYTLLRTIAPQELPSVILFG